MLSQHPLEIPELAALIASYLTGKDLARCIRVSKSWRDIFLPHRWRHIKRVHKWSEGSRKRYGPSLEALSNHRHLVQHLHIYRPHMDDYEMCTHPNLRDLMITIDLEQPPLDWDLAAKSPLLEHLFLCNIEMGLGCLQGLSYLRKLRLTNVIIRNGPGFWEACKNLESLSMEYVQVEGGFVSIPSDIVFDRLRTLCILRMAIRGVVSASEQMTLIPHCPNLETFQWNLYTLRVRISIDHPIDKDRCPALDNQSLPEKPSDAEWASVFERFRNCLGKFTLLNLRDGTFGPQAFKALDFHFGSLVEIGLNNTTTTSYVVRDVLCSCPILEVLEARDILASDIAEGGPWICQQLRHLKIYFRVKKSE